MTCYHEPYRCTQVLVPDWAVCDTHYGKPVLTRELRVGCVCPCPPCTTLRMSRHIIGAPTCTHPPGCPGYPPGVLRADWEDLARSAQS